MSRWPDGVCRAATGDCVPRRSRAGSTPLVAWRYFVERRIDEQLPLLAAAALIALLALFGDAPDARGSGTGPRRFGSRS